MAIDPITDTRSRPADRSNSLNRSSFSRRLIRKLILVFIISILGLTAMSFTGQRPENLGHINGRLANCPDSPNCVCSQVQAGVQPEEYQMDPIPYDSLRLISDGQTVTKAALIQRIKETIERNFSRASLVSESDRYLHFEFRSLLFRFVDDVEFYLDDNNQQVHFRSASRVGYSDMGVNRKRMNKISQELKK